MKEEANVSGCGRENDLIAFLYNELDPVAKKSFHSHLQECGSCSAELSEFGNIRESVVAWRNEALVGVILPAAQISPAVRSDTTKVSALNALREFFNLSPLWMKGAVVFASLLFCLFAVLAASRLRDTAPPPPSAAIPNIKKYSEQELNAVVDRRVQDALERIRNSTTPPTSQVSGSDQASRRKATNRGSEVASTTPQQKARRPLSKDERQQLAADLRLIEDPTESNLDLLDDRINQ